MDLFIVESPFQLLSATEALHRFKSHDSLLIVKKTPEKKNNDQVDELLKLGNWSKIIKVPSPFRVFVAEFFIVPIVSYLKISRKRINRIFIGEPRNYLMNVAINNLTHKESYFLDDGNLTFWIQNQLLDHKSVSRIIFKKKGSIRQLYYHLFILQTEFSELPDWFTCFDIESIDGQKIVKNSFEYLRSKINNNLGSDKVYFIGGNLSELGILSQKNELSQLKQVVSYYQKRKISLVYCVHRRESEDKIQLIQKLSRDLEIRRSSYPLEMEIVIKGIGIRNIGSFYSTALLTLKKIFSPDNVNMFVIPPELIEDTFKKELRNTVESYGFEVEKVPLFSHS